MKVFAIQRWTIAKVTIRAFQVLNVLAQCLSSTSHRENQRKKERKEQRNLGSFVQETRGRVGVEQRARRNKEIISEFRKKIGNKESTLCDCELPTNTIYPKPLQLNVPLQHFSAKRANVSIPDGSILTNGTKNRKT